MHLTELLSATAVATPPPLDPEIAGLTADSRLVRPGYLFAALPGTRLDGRDFAAEAVARGAVAILTDRVDALGLSPANRERVAVVVDANPHRCLSLLAARFCGRPPHTVAAVTGTNGKTSVVEFLRQLWTAQALPAASLGTLGLVTSRDRRPGVVTTPDPVALHHILASLAQSGIEHAALEASSHGLAQYRLDGLSIAAAAFTNLTRDHLDYHGDMRRYRTAKERLFGELLAPGGTAVINADSAEFPRLRALCRERGSPILAYGSDPAADLRLVSRRPRAGGQTVLLDIFAERHELILPLAGEFQAMNALAAFGSGARDRLCGRGAARRARPIDRDRPAGCNSSPSIAPAARSSSITPIPPTRSPPCSLRCARIPRVDWRCCSAVAAIAIPASAR